MSTSLYTYRNPWFTPGKAWMGAEFYTTDVKPVDYRGFQIFNRFKGNWELVKDGVCLTQRAGGGALKSLADALLGDRSEEPAWLVERARAIAKKFGANLKPSQVAA